MLLKDFKFFPELQKVAPKIWAVPTYNADFPNMRKMGLLSCSLLLHLGAIEPQTDFTSLYAILNTLNKVCAQRGERKQLALANAIYTWFNEIKLGDMVICFLANGKFAMGEVVGECHPNTGHSNFMRYAYPVNWINKNFNVAGVDVEKGMRFVQTSRRTIVALDVKTRMGCFVHVLRDLSSWNFPLGSKIAAVFIEYLRYIDLHKFESWCGFINEHPEFKPDVLPNGKSFDSVIQLLAAQYTTFNSCEDELPAVASAKQNVSSDAKDESEVRADAEVQAGDGPQAGAEHEDDSADQLLSAVPLGVDAEEWGEFIASYNAESEVEGEFKDESDSNSTLVFSTSMDEDDTSTKLGSQNTDVWAGLMVVFNKKSSSDQASEIDPSLSKSHDEAQTKGAADDDTSAKKEPLVLDAQLDDDFDKSAGDTDPWYVDTQLADGSDKSAGDTDPWYELVKLLAGSGNNIPTEKENRSLGVQSEDEADEEYDPKNDLWYVDTLLAERPDESSTNERKMWQLGADPLFEPHNSLVRYHPKFDDPDEENQKSNSTHVQSFEGNVADFFTGDFEEDYHENEELYAKLLAQERAKDYPKLPHHISKELLDEAIKADAELNDYYNGLTQKDGDESNLQELTDGEVNNPEALQQEAFIGDHEPKLLLDSDLDVSHNHTEALQFDNAHEGVADDHEEKIKKDKRGLHIDLSSLYSKQSLEASNVADAVQSEDDKSLGVQSVVSQFQGTNLSTDQSKGNAAPKDQDPVKVAQSEVGDTRHKKQVTVGVEDISCKTHDQHVNGLNYGHSELYYQALDFSSFNPDRAVKTQSSHPKHQVIRGVDSVDYREVYDIQFSSLPLLTLPELKLLRQIAPYSDMSENNIEVFDKVRWLISKNLANIDNLHATYDLPSYQSSAQDTDVKPQRIRTSRFTGFGSYLKHWSFSVITQRIQDAFVGHDFEVLIADLLRVQGFDVHLFDKNDYGIFMVAESSKSEEEQQSLCVQIHDHVSTIDRYALDHLRGLMIKNNSEYALLVTWGGINHLVVSQYAMHFLNFRMWGDKELVTNFLEHYSELSEEVRSKIPLKQVWALNR